ncbi:hypothetical protein M427DRAFT_355351 [Gonapodya prolifera JEL478]|uniref:Uncharacterized protein n=1 Tax=Gonapodya prolifera (strain JEL478) TaxID=1344416 RepID=A0A139ABY7_GONPJ|nr:hypothetical protein M427DRAFT_355351 [Gonapodya prolifera JEL478]|eukprot:KXS14169.1 hypothetical protein M427DRAFT_355351 [Gonapodya prolifera JEL478]
MLKRRCGAPLAVLDAIRRLVPRNLPSLPAPDFHVFFGRCAHAVAAQTCLHEPARAIHTCSRFTERARRCGGSVGWEKKD